MPRIAFPSNRRQPISQIGGDWRCEAADAEAIILYGPGGFHPVRLGDQLKDGRYKILHKLGSSNFSTIWAARDRMEQRYVTVKIYQSKWEETNEVPVFRSISSLPKNTHSGQQHIVQFFDSFDVEGPSGRHQCLVLELLGPCILDLFGAASTEVRLPALQAKSIAHQILLATDLLASQGIAHGDIHTRNIAFTIPNLDPLPEHEFIKLLGEPETGLVSRCDGSTLESYMPPYLVMPATFEESGFFKDLPSSSTVKLIDFGSSFFEGKAPNKLIASLSARAPEATFGDPIDIRADLWSMGCLLFELLTGQIPFHTVPLTSASAFAAVRGISDDKLPDRWEEKWQEMKKELRMDCDDSDPDVTLYGWLERAYYYRKEWPCELTKEDLTKIGDLLERMWKYEPSSRPSTKDLLNDPWWLQQQTKSVDD
ncbi:kinase-like domain-containing protein [Nemania abortiva]|nr:kinase-like domain-containing protein [Nemania abortiva]